jgi:hypothetical protein
MILSEAPEFDEKQKSCTFGADAELQGTKTVQWGAA